MKGNQGKFDRKSRVLGWVAVLSTGVALAMSASAAFGQSDSSGRHFALCVGINQYSISGANNLQGCVNDAEGVANTLMRDSRWSQQDVYLVTDTQATKAGVRGALYQLGSEAGPGDVVLYFQSSHGSQQSGTDTSLVMTDEMYSDAELGSDLAQAFNEQTTVILVIDACHSGGLFRSGPQTRAQRAAANASFVQNVLTAMQATRQARGGAARSRSVGSHVGFITAADYNQFSQETNGMGVFARNFIAAFAERNADTNSDGLMSFWELGTWAGEKASAENPDQTAQMFNDTLLNETIASDLQTSESGGFESGSEGGAGGGFDPGMASAGTCGAMGLNGPLMAGLSLVGAAFARTRVRIRRS